MARATGSYPVGHGFKSNLRYHWPVGQAAKTPPFHGGNGSSILPRVTKKRTHTFRVCVLFLLPRSRVRRGVCAAYAGVRIRHSEIDKLACQAQSERIFAAGEILPLYSLSKGASSQTFCVFAKQNDDFSRQAKLCFSLLATKYILPRGFLNPKA